METKCIKCGAINNHLCKDEGIKNALSQKDETYGRTGFLASEEDMKKVDEVEGKEKVWAYVVNAVQEESASREEFYAVLDEFLAHREEGLRGRIEAMQFKMDVDEYLPKVKAWNGTNYDVPFDDGYAQCKKDIAALLSDK